MKKCFLVFTLLAFSSLAVAQKIDFELYTLDNGMDVILHQDNKAPVISIGVMYHVGAKDETEGRTGFAHFFEHLLFEGTKNIERGKWFDIVSSHGGSNNANTTQDRTYYYEVFPSNNLELAIWMESERLYHPIIEQVGVDTQNEVVKEEKRTRIDNQPYGAVAYGMAIDKYLFKKHPYKDPVIGTMEDLDAAKLEEFIQFKEKYYVPNNATLVLAGDFQTDEAKRLINLYFGSIPRGKEVPRLDVKEAPITENISATEYDSNIQIPLKIIAFRTPGFKDREAYVLNMISSVLTDGSSSRMYKRMVEDEKVALQVLAFPRSQEDYSVFTMGALPLGEVSLDKLTDIINEEIVKLQTDLISDVEYQKLQNKFENRFVSSNSSVNGIASSLATYHMLYGDANLINSEIDIYRSITKEEIREVARKYLNKNQRLDLNYLPKPESN